MAEDRQRIKKLELTPKSPSADESLEVIVRVFEPDYVPKDVEVRAHISDRIFTSVIPAELLQALEDDPGVQSVAVSRSLRTIG